LNAVPPGGRWATGREENQERFEVAAQASGSPRAADQAAEEAAVGSVHDQRDAKAGWCRVSFFEDPADQVDVDAWDDGSARQPLGSELPEDGQKLLEFYRLLLANSSLGSGGRLVCKWAQKDLAAKLGVHVRTIKRYVADLREPGPDPRHPNAPQTGRRLAWLQVVPHRTEKGEHKGKLIGDWYVLLLDYEEAVAAAALVAGSRSKPQLKVKGHEAEEPSPQVTVKGHETDGSWDTAEGSWDTPEPAQKPELRDKPEEPLSPAQGQGTRPPLSLPNRSTALEVGEDSQGSGGAVVREGEVVRVENVGMVSGPPFRSRWEEMAWVRSQRRHGAWSDPVVVKSEATSRLDSEARAVVLEAAARREVDADQVRAFEALARAGVADGASVEVAMNGRRRDLTAAERAAALEAAARVEACAPGAWWLLWDHREPLLDVEDSGVPVSAGQVAVLMVAAEAGLLDERVVASARPGWEELAA
jgi:hypothetical protein